LKLRQRFGLTVIGMIDRIADSDGSYDQRTVVNPAPDQPLTEADVLIVLGEDEGLDRFERSAAQARKQPETVPPRSTGASHDEPR
jgi:K+/H+ antiporter YhaU regulatory subunit KhtT